jgi:glycosyltransferase involved in cell wall biosynthesis
VRLTILSVAYPFAPVSPDAVGGAEQILSALDAALVAAGHRSIVVAQEGSRVAGTLVPVPAPAGSLDRDSRAEGHARHREAIRTALARHPVDVVHLHGVDFDAYRPPSGTPTLATLHLPVSWYGPDALAPRPDMWLHCVSGTQHRDAAGLPNLLPPIPNGIDVTSFSGRHAKRSFALVLGRICPEKGIHLALEAAHVAGLPLLIGGRVFPYAEHERYFAAEIAPRLDARRRFLGPLDLARKRRFLAAARCLVVPSRVAETSSLVAREALASGTPVVAFPAGALAETVEHGRTGILVDDVPAMARAMREAASLDPEACRAAARARFPLDRMVAGYLDAYRRILAAARPLAAVS